MAQHTVTSGPKLDPAKGYAFLREPWRLRLRAIIAFVVTLALLAFGLDTWLNQGEPWMALLIGAIALWRCIFTYEVICDLSDLPKRVVVLTAEGFHDVDRRTLHEAGMRLHIGSIRSVILSHFGLNCNFDEPHDAIMDYWQFHGSKREHS